MPASLMSSWVVKLGPLLSMSRLAAATMDFACSTPRPLERCTTGDRSAARSAHVTGTTVAGFVSRSCVWMDSSLPRTSEELRTVGHGAPVVRGGMARQTD